MANILLRPVLEWQKPNRGHDRGAVTGREEQNLYPEPAFQNLAQLKKKNIQ